MRRDLIEKAEQLLLRYHRRQQLQRHHRQRQLIETALFAALLALVAIGVFTLWERLVP